MNIKEELMLKCSLQIDELHELEEHIMSIYNNTNDKTDVNDYFKIMDTINKIISVLNNKNYIDEYLKLDKERPIASDDIRNVALQIVKFFDLQKHPEIHVTSHRFQIGFRMHQIETGIPDNVLYPNCRYYQLQQFLLIGNNFRIANETDIDKLNYVSDLIMRGYMCTLLPGISLYPNAETIDKVTSIYEHLKNKTDYYFIYEHTNEDIRTKLTYGKPILKDLCEVEANKHISELGFEAFPDIAIRLRFLTSKLVEYKLKCINSYENADPFIIYKYNMIIAACRDLYKNINYENLFKVADAINESKNINYNELDDQLIEIINILLQTSLNE